MFAQVIDYRLHFVCLYVASYMLHVMCCMSYIYLVCLGLGLHKQGAPVRQVAGVTVQEDFMHQREQRADDEAGHSPVVSDDDVVAGASSDGDGRSEEAPGGQGAGLWSGGKGDGNGEREVKLPPAPGFSAPNDVELLVRTFSGAFFLGPRQGGA